MVWFTVEITYTQDREKLMAVRSRHREYLAGLVDQGKVGAAGPWADDTAGFIIYRVEDRAELDQLLDEDPYTKEGVAAGRTVHEWNLRMGSVGSA